MKEVSLPLINPKSPSASVTEIVKMGARVLSVPPEKNAFGETDLNLSCGTVVNLSFLHAVNRKQAVIINKVYRIFVFYYSNLLIVIETTC